MSNYVFPALPLLDVALERENVEKTRIFENPGGTEQRVGFYAAPRYRYRLRWNGLRTYVNAPSPWAAYTELGILLYFHDVHRGEWDSFYYVDPTDNTQRRVRFEEGSLRIRRIFNGGYEAEATFITVSA